ncbi:MAG: citryl-CoA lyase [Pseudomonadota bacterium]
MSDSNGDWWATEIIDMSPGEIRYRGYPIEELIGRVGFAEMVWLMLRGSLPTKSEAALLEVALMSAVDHGPQAPSIAIARMAATCGVGLQSAMASGLNVLGDVHGGAGEAAVGLYEAVAAHETMEAGAKTELDRFFASGEHFVPGFGHRFHPVDPRAPRLIEVTSEAVSAGSVTGKFLAAAQAVEAELQARKGKLIPMNIDGATAIIFAELGFPGPLARGLFCLSRSVGLLAHAWEQTQQGGRNKGPLPRDQLWRYTGLEPRKVPGA